MFGLFEFWLPAGLGLVIWIDWPRLMVGASFVAGFAGKVEYGPSWIERFCGGLPRSLPLLVLLLPCQALETAGPCLFRDRNGDLPDSGPADFGSSTEGVNGKVARALRAECGYGLAGVGVSFERH